MLPCRKQLTRGPSWAPQSPTRRIPNSTRACRLCMFPPVSTSLRVTHLQGRLWACLLSAVCTVCTPPDARSAVFWRDPRKPCWHSLPLQLGLGHSRGLGQQAFCLLSTSSPTHPAHLPHLVFRHICTSLGKISPDTEVKLNLEL